jgi:hypothetical protein
MNELEEYIKIKDNNTSDFVYENISSFNKNSTCEDFSNLESFNQIVSEKNCLIEELKSYCDTLKLKFEDEIMKYSIEVIFMLIIVLGKSNENQDYKFRR